MWSFSLDTFKWTPLPSSGEIPLPRAFFSAVASVGTIHIVNGNAAPGNPLNSAELLANVHTYALNKHRMANVSYGGWVPDPRAGHSMVVRDDIPFLYGGRLLEGRRLCDMWRLNIPEQLWEYEYYGIANPDTEVVPAQPPCRDQHAWSIYNSTHSAMFGGQGAGVYYNDLWLFDHELNVWTLMDAEGMVPTGRRLPSIVPSRYIDGVLISGGQHGSERLNDVWRYTFNTSSWTKAVGPPFPPPPEEDDEIGEETAALLPITARVGSAFLSFPSRGLLYAYGGMDQKGTELQDAWAYHESVGGWEQLNFQSKISPRHYHTIVTSDGLHAYVFGGTDGIDILGDTWRLSLQLKRWERLNFGVSITPNRRMLASAFHACGIMYLFGGTDGPQYFNDIWRFIPPPPNAPMNGHLRLLSASEDDRTGKLEIAHESEWGSVCSKGFTHSSAHIACKSMGMHSGARLGPPTNTSSSPCQEHQLCGDADQTIWLDSVHCKGSESQLSACSRSSWGKAKCTHSDDVMIMCGEGAIRLGKEKVYDSGAISGRLEIFHDGVWGTICYNPHSGNGNATASAACRHLKLPEPGMAIVSMEKPTPMDSVPIHMANLDCVETESRLDGCMHAGWQDIPFFCTHAYDLHIQCG